MLNYKCKQNMTKAHICPIIRFGRLYIGPVKTGTMGVSIRFATGKGGQLDVFPKRRQGHSCK